LEEKKNPNLVNDAKHIDTIGTYWYNSILFYLIAYKDYICIFQEYIQKIFYFFTF